jgi:hypothetical protein
MSTDNPQDQVPANSISERPYFVNPETAKWFTEDPRLYKLYKKHLPIIPFYYRYFPTERIDWPKIEHYLSQGFTLRELLRFTVHKADQYRSVLTIKQGEILTVIGVLLVWAIIAFIFRPLDGFDVLSLLFFYMFISLPWTLFIALQCRITFLSRVTSNSSNSLLKALSIDSFISEYSLVKESLSQLYIITIRIISSLVVMVLMVFLFIGCIMNGITALAVILVPILYGAYMNHIANKSTEEKKYSIEQEFNNSLEDYLFLLECYKSKYRHHNDSWYVGNEEKVVEIINKMPRIAKAERQKLLNIIGKIEVVPKGGVEPP